ncbi:MAG: phosphatase PAP2 family protein [Actinobacteria bacterium]|nr:phosphatase PAP2 family protein [Actinomycetota bacterium]
MAREHRRTSLLQSFNYAFQGLVYAVRYQRNMRIHLGIGALALVVGVFLNLSRLEFVAVVAAVTFVLVMELLNSAVEKVVDMITEDYDPRAKAAKDLSAAAVLVAAINALVVAYLVMVDRLSHFSLDLLMAIRRSPSYLTVVAFGVVMAAVIAVKAVRGRGTPLSGGLPSGHAALAFAGWTAVTFLVGATREGLLVSMITLGVAALAAQSRVEGGIHSLLEVVLGALLGVIVTTLIFQLWF